MRTVYFASPAEAVPALRALTARGHSVAAVYTRPDRPAGRSSKPQRTPVREAAEAAGIPVFTPKSLRDAAVHAQLSGHAADAFVVVAYGRLLPAEVLRIPRLGVLNVHPSLLPKYRGPSPVQQAILDGVSETGVSIMLLDEGMDTGPLLAQARVTLNGDEKGGRLTAHLFDRGAALLVATLDRWAAGELKPAAQDEAQASVTKLLSREDGEIDWTQPAEKIARMVRAYDPWPGTHTRWTGKVLKILEAVAVSGTGARHGEARLSGGALDVAAGDGSLRITRIQVEGRPAVHAQDFARGHPSINGAVFPS